MAKNWAITIGINQYENMPTLKYAQRDAELVRDWFLNEAGFEKVYYFSDNSLPITDAGKPFSSQPTYGTLKRFLRVRFNKSFLSTGDNLWFFFSGHGLRHADRDYLMPSDADPHPEGLEDTAIPLNYVTERLRRCGADNVILLLDACRNEGSSKGLGVGEEKLQGVITIASCSPSERSYEIEDLQQGSFTYALLESLRIQGEGNCATVERLYQRLRYRVAEINRQYQKPQQTPLVITEPATKFHLILLPKQATLNDIARRKKDALLAEVEGDWELARQLWIRVNIAAAGSDMDAIKAIQRFSRVRQQYTEALEEQKSDLGTKPTWSLPWKLIGLGGVAVSALLVVVLNLSSLQPTGTETPPNSGIVSSSRLGKSPWRKSWTCSLRFTSGGSGTLVFDAASPDLFIPRWSLDMETPFESRMFRSRGEQDGFWFSEKHQITFHLVIEGRHVKTILNVIISAKPEASQDFMDVSGFFKRKNVRESWKGSCKTQD